MSDFWKRVALVQQNLKAPKGQFNKFGNYRHRSCEDILEAVKPLLAEHGLILSITDEVELVGDRYYVHAIAALRDIDSDGYHSTSAWAREAESKKGMDESQVTGSTSSYARKYALGGLLAIDDTKDPDSTNDHGASFPSEKQRAFYFSLLKIKYGNDIPSEVIKNAKLMNADTMSQAIKALKSEAENG